MTITPADIAVVRKLGRPPRLIRLIMDCVLILFGRPMKNPIRFDPEIQGAEPSWESSLKVNRIVFHSHHLSNESSHLLAHVRYGLSAKSPKLPEGSNQ